MHPAKAALLTNALAPFWEQLRAWVASAMHNHHNSRDKLTREEIIPLRTSIFLIENMLRRLILIAATAVTLDITARWSPAAKDNAATKAKHSPKAIVRKTKGFRLFVFGSGPPGARPAATPQRGAAQSPHRVHVSKIPPDMTPEEFNRWCETDDLEAAKAAANAEYREATRERAPRPPRKPAQQGSQKLEKKTVPQLIDATAHQARLVMLAELAANPEAMIQRAAIAMAKRREIAYRLSLTPPPKARGHLALSAAVLGTLIPFHHDFTHAMSLFALSYTEPDTS